MVSYILDCGGKREMCEKHKTRAAAATLRPDMAGGPPSINSEREDPGEAKTSPLGISAYQTKFVEE